MRRFCFLACVCVINFSILAETQYQSAAKVLEQIDAAKMARDSQSRSKLKSIEFEDQGYRIESYFKLGSLETGNPVIISKMDGTPILSGKVKESEPKLKVDGIRFLDGGISMFGLFQISNTEGGEMSYKARKGGNLQIEGIDLTFVQGNDHGTSLILDCKASNIYLDGKSGGREWLSLSSPIKNPSTFDYDQSVLRSVLMSLKNDVEIEYSGRTFHGTVSVSGNGGSPLAITPLDGYATCDDGRTITVAASGKNVVMTISKANAKDLTYKLPSSHLSEEDWWNENKFAQLYAASQAAAKSKSAKSEPAEAGTSAAGTASAKSARQQPDTATPESATSNIPSYLYIIAATLLLTIILLLTLRSRKK